MKKLHLLTALLFMGATLFVSSCTADKQEIYEPGNELLSETGTRSGYYIALVLQLIPQPSDFHVRFQWSYEHNEFPAGANIYKLMKAVNGGNYGFCAYIPLERTGEYMDSVPNLTMNNYKYQMLLGKLVYNNGIEEFTSYGGSTELVVGYQAPGGGGGGGTTGPEIIRPIEPDPWP